VDNVVCSEEIMSSTPSVPVELPKPPKLDLDEFIASALSATPSELHPFFQSFSDLYTRK
jgi:26S proteasome regulatory subunit N9